MIIQVFRVAAAALICIGASDVFAQDAGEAFTASGCGACHGDEGRGSALGPNIATGELNSADFIDYIRSPTGTMPAYNASSVSNESLTEMHATLEPVNGSVEPLGNAERGAVLYRQSGCYQCHAN